MPTIKYEAVLTPEEFDLFSKYLRDLEKFRSKILLDSKKKELDGWKLFKEIMYNELTGPRNLNKI